MSRIWFILVVIALVVALPFVFRKRATAGTWRPGDPVLVVISPHNEAIRQEFARAFSEWHRVRYGHPVKVDWRNIGGTSEIIRYLESEYVAAFRGWWRGQGRTWPAGGEMILDRRFKAEPVPDAVASNREELAQWRLKADAHATFRKIDDAAAFTSGMDLLFGGGSYDHGKLGGEGIGVPAWEPGKEPVGLFASTSGVALIPERLSGEVWRGPTFYGTAVSTFGICYNLDRLSDIGVTQPPGRWEDLAAPVWFRQLGLADPTKSGSIAKAFEMIIQEACWQGVLAAGYSKAQVMAFEKQISAARLPEGKLPEGIPAGYQAAVEAGWLAGINRVRRIGANARYFTDSASKVPIDVSVGDAAAGIAIDFYARYQAGMSGGADGRPRMRYITPKGGSSVSADPICLLRGAPHREVAVRFMEFVLGEDGQKLWNYRPGEPGGPQRYALARLPIRRDFYPGDASEFKDAWLQHKGRTSDDLGDPEVNPYALAGDFEYQPRWTGSHFNVHRNLIRAMCMESGEELQAAWSAIIQRGGPDAQPAAMAVLERLPEQPEALTWGSAPGLERKIRSADLMRDWVRHFRRTYAEARQMALAAREP